MLLEQVVTIQAQILDFYQPALLGSQQFLARAYRQNGRTKEAIALLKYVVSVYERTAADDNLLRLTS